MLRSCESVIVKCYILGLAVFCCYSGLGSLRALAQCHWHLVRDKGGSDGSSEIKLYPFLTSSLVKLWGEFHVDVHCSYFPHEARVKLVLLVDCVVIHSCNYVALGHTRHSPLLLVFSRLDNTHLQECGDYLLRVCP
jgi:hypothetical protein